jgi:hypothetical protein
MIAKRFWMRESALTAGVDVTLPVIAQGWFCGSCLRSCVSRDERHAAEGSQSVKALWATRALRPPQKRSRMARLRPVGAIRMQLHFGADAPLLHESRLAGSVAKRFQKAAGERGLGQPWNSRIANAVRVAGPDRISFLSAVVGLTPSLAWFLAITFSLELRFLFPYHSTESLSREIDATVAPQIINFGSVFQCNYRTSTSALRVRSRSPWLTTLRKQNCDDI